MFMFKRSIIGLRAAAVILLLVSVLPQRCSGEGKVYLIGIDGAEWRVINYLIQKGQLPVIKKMKEEGAYGYLATDIGCSPVSWTSIATGKSMEKHGIDSDEFFKREYDPSVKIKTKRIWDILEKEGKKVGVYKWYFTYPERKINGFWVPKLLSGEPYLGERPAAAAEEEDMLLKILDKHDCDFVAAFWHTVDPSQHFFWLYHEMNESEGKKTYPPQVRRQIDLYAERIYSAYREFDLKIGELIKCLGPDDSLIVVSDHGFQLSQELTKEIRVNDGFMDKIGVLKGSGGADASSASGIYKGAKFRVKVDYTGSYKSDIFHGNNKYRENVKFPVIRVIFDDFPGQKGTQEAIEAMKNEMELMKDMGRKAFNVSSGLGGEIVLKPSGGIKQVFDELREPLDTDIFEVDVRTGDHWAVTPGIILLYGNTFKKGHEIKRARLYDVVPTVLFLMDLPVGEDMDGKVLNDAFKDQKEFKFRYVDSYDRECPKEMTSEYPRYQADNCFEIKKVFLIGLDGGDLGVIDYLIGKRELPAFKLIKQGGSFGRLSTDKGLAQISWTSIATGKNAYKHGIDLNRPAAQDNIRVKRIWDILQENGLKVGIFKWFLTNPSVKVNGFWVPQYDTDLPYLPGAKAVFTDSFPYLSNLYDFSFYAAILGTVEKEQQNYWLCHVLNHKRERRGHTIEVTQQIAEGADKIYSGYRDFDAQLGEIIKYMAAEDCLIVVSAYGAAEADAIETKITLSGRFLDKIGITGGWKEGKEQYAEGELNGVKFKVIADYSCLRRAESFPLQSLGFSMKVIEPVLRFNPDGEAPKEKWKAAEESIIKLLQGITLDKTFVFILQERSENGLVFELSKEVAAECEKVVGAGEIGVLDVNARTGDHWEKTPGMVMFYGKPFRKGFEINGAYLCDVVPTILYLFGLPAGKDMDGKVISGVFERLCGEPAYIDSYGLKRHDPSSGKVYEMDPKQKRNLRSLGYIQ